MAIPTLQGLQTALSGLIAQQTALDVTGSNIANANTEGYSRETALLQPNPPLDIPAISTLTGEGAQLGTGVACRRSRASATPTSTPSTARRTAR